MSAIYCSFTVFIPKVYTCQSKRSNSISILNNVYSSATENATLGASHHFPWPALLVIIYVWMQIKSNQILIHTIKMHLSVLYNIWKQCQIEEQEHKKTSLQLPMYTSNHTCTTLEYMAEQRGSMKMPLMGCCVLLYFFQMWIIVQRLRDHTHISSGI